MKNLEIGAIYEHYKGGIYQVLYEAINSENQEHLVIYKNLNDDILWARPKHMFLENIVLDGKETERFKKIEQHVLTKSNERYN